MVFSKDLIDDGVVKLDKQQYGSISDEEASSLLGRREQKKNKDFFDKTAVSRLGLIGSLVMFLALSSAASVLFMNRQEDAGMTATVGLVSSSASASSSYEKEGSVEYVNGGFSGGKGTPIFVIKGASSCEPFIFDTIIDQAKEASAYIIAGESGTKLSETIEAIREELECNADETQPDHCFVLMMNCDSGRTLPRSRSGKSPKSLSIERLDAQNKIHEIAEVDPDTRNSMLKVGDIISDTKNAFDLLAREELSDGPLKSFKVLEPVEEISRDECGGPASWSDPKTKVYHLTLEAANHPTVVASKFQTRTMNGEIPGPLIKIKPGETVRLYFRNKLPPPPHPTVPCNNNRCDPNHSNLHYHGGHVSGDEPSDDPELSIAPGECYNYETYFPENHMPGTHWIHPHYHGSSAIQVGGGAALPFIVEDDPSVFPIPPEVVSANDVLLFVQSFNHEEVKRNVGRAYKNETLGKQDDIYQWTPYDPDFADSVNQFRLVNGQYRPSLKIKTGEWNRFRVVYGGWDNSVANLNFKIRPTEKTQEECETYLLAKDGIYIKDYPRKLTDFPIPAASRADIMVRCNAPGKFTVTSYVKNEELMSIEAEGDHVISLPPTYNFDWKFPAYLQDVIDEPVHGDCKCETDMQCGSSNCDDGICCINRLVFKKNVAIHTIKFGEVVQRDLVGLEAHPYHQHVYPFQLTEGFDPNDLDPNGPTQGGFFKNGDWHDNIRSPNQDTASIKFRADVHNGKLMLHCHRLVHEDLGMMSQEQVVYDRECECDARWKPPEA